MARSVADRRGPTPARRVLIPAVAVAVLGLPILLAGCGATGGSVFRGPSRWAYDASSDSLGIEQFAALPLDEQLRRADQAAIWRLRAQQSARLEDRVHCLVNAGGLAPDDPDNWLDLVDVWRWVGDYVRTSNWLDNAVEAVSSFGYLGPDALGGSDTPEYWAAARRTGLARAWLHYDRAEWREGLTWTSVLYRRAPGDAEVIRAHGLLAAGAARPSIALRMAEDLERNDPFKSDGRWIRSVLDRARGFPVEAFSYFSRIESGVLHASERWRDMGETAEVLRRYSHAERYYRNSFHNLPFADRSGIERVRYLRLGGENAAQEMGFWLAFDRFYVTGSLSSYTRFAWDRFENAAEPAQREFWAGQLVNGAGILLRKGMDEPWALRVRGLAFLATGQYEKCRVDLRRCSRLLTGLGQEDGRVEAGLGGVLLRREKFGAALPHLRRAVALDASNASAWADLGLALVMTGDRTEGRRALDRALREDPENATAWYNRGLLNLRAGDFEQAESDLQQAARLAPGNQDVVDLLQRAHSLQKRNTQRGSRTKAGKDPENE